MRLSPWLFVPTVMALEACSGVVEIDVPVGPITYTVSADQVTIPDALRDSSNNTIRSIPCSTDNDCPQLGAGQPAVHCPNAVCAPDPFTFELATNVVDLDQNATVQQFGSHITGIEVRNVTYDVSSQGLTAAVGPTDLYWGGESAVNAESDGVQHLGTVPQFQLQAGATLPQQSVTLDTVGSMGLSAYLVGTSHRVRFFARPQLAVVPGAPVPSGAVALNLHLQVHIQGQLVR